MTDELNESERLVVCALRRWVAALRNDPCDQVGLLTYDFRSQLADLGDTGFSRFIALMQVLTANARRPFTHGALCCRAVSGDEILFAALIGACQQGHWLIARDRAEQLVNDSAVGDLIGRASAFGQTLGARLPELRSDRLAVPMAATLH